MSGSHREAGTERSAPDRAAVPVIAAEIGQTPDELATRLGNQVDVDGASGLRTLPAHTCKQLISQHHQQLAAQAQAAREQAAHQAAQREQAERQHAAAQRAREARAQAQREILRETPDLSALELMLAGDHDPSRRTASGIAFDELYQGERRGDIGYGYRLSPTPTKE